MDLLFLVKCTKSESTGKQLIILTEENKQIDNWQSAQQTNA